MLAMIVKDPYKTEDEEISEMSEEAHEELE